MWSFSDFQYRFRSSWSTTDLLTVAYDRIARVFDRSGATRTVALDISNSFGRVWHTGLLHKLRSDGILGLVSGFVSFFFSNKRLQGVQDGKSLQEYPVTVGVPQGSNLAPTIFLPYTNYLPDDGIYIHDNTTFYFYDQVYDLWQELEWSSAFKSDLRDTVDWAKKWLFNFNTGWTQLVLFGRSHNSGAVDEKMKRWVCS